MKSEGFVREGLAKNEVASARNRQGAFSFSTLPTAAKFARQCGFGGFWHKYALSRQRTDTGADRGLDGAGYGYCSYLAAKEVLWPFECRWHGEPADSRQICPSVRFHPFLA